MVTWIHRVEEAGTGPRLAVKDLFAVAGVATSAGCPAYAAAHPEPAARDAAVVAAMRAAGGRLAGLTTLHELALGRTGVNGWYGTAVNPLDPRLIPGGSSSGSAVAVATGEADIGVGTDTGGSLRIPAACCGIAGLKPTHGRYSTDGVVPAARSLDTVGFLAADVAGLRTALRLAEAAADVPSTPAAPGRVGDLAGGDLPVEPVIGRLRGYALPELETAVDCALASTDWAVREVALPTFRAAEEANYAINVAEALAEHGALLGRPGLGADVAGRLQDGLTADVAAARAVAAAWRTELATTFRAVDLIALPTLATRPTAVDAPPTAFAALTRAANLAGIPALAVPLPGGPGFSLQLMGPAGAERALLSAGEAIERGVR